MTRGQVIAVLFLALVYRLAAILVFPVVFDEVQVMAYGLAKALSAGHPWSLVFEVPLTVSNGITPLWYWAQALPAWLLGETTKLGLRTLPLILGLLGAWLCSRVGSRLGGRRVAFLAGVLYALQSPLIVVNARGEFAESLLAPLGLLMLLDLRRPPEGGPIPLRAALWPALALFAYFGKGLLIWGSYALFLSALFWLDRRRQAGTSLGLGRAAGLILAPLVPSLAWLLAAQRALFRGGAGIVTDLGPVASVAESVRRLTLDYGTGPTRFMTAGWKEALFVYTDFRVWPSLALLAVPYAVALGGLAWRLAQGLVQRRADESESALLPLCLVLPPLAVLLAKGALDARFHLLYLAVLLPYVAVVLDDWAGLLEGRRFLPFVAWGLLEAAYFSWSLGRSWPLGACLGMALVAAVAGLAKGGLRAGTATAALVVVALSVGNGVAGPLVWGRQWAWEPNPVTSDAPRPVADFPNADLQLAECFAAREGPAQARAFMLRALERHPDDPATVSSASAHLLRMGREEATLLIARLNEYVRRHPEDEEARRHLATALDKARGR